MKNFTDVYIYKILWGIWIITFGLGLYHIWCSYTTQNHYLRIEAILVDFEQKPSYTIGGLIPEKNDTRPIAREINCSGDTFTESDIILPTRFVPAKIGELKYAKGKLRLELNGCIDYNDENDKLLNRVAYPKIFSNGERIKDKSISEEVLLNGLTIGYALKENQRIEIRLERISGKKFKLYITPRPNNLQYIFRSEELKSSKKINLIYGKKLSHKDIDQCDRSEVVVFHYNNFGEPKTNEIIIRENTASVGKDEFVGSYLLDGRIYINYSPREGLGIPLTYMAVTVLFFVLFAWIPLYKPSGERRSYRQLIKGEQRGSTFIFLFIPILSLAIFYNIGSILLAHYYFHFERNDYFFSGLFNYLTTGIFFIFFFLSFRLRFYLGDSLTRISEIIEKLTPLAYILLVILICPILMILWYFSDDQRALGFIPSHSVVRLVTILFYFFAGLFFINRDFWKMALTLTLLCGLCFITGDTGFAFLSVATFFFLVTFNPKLAPLHKIFFFITPILMVFLAFHFIASDYQRERLKLVYTDYTDLGSENSSSIENANKESTDKQRIILHEAFNSNLTGYWSELRIPPEFKTVIWSDYILLYAFLYFGGLGTIFFVIVPLLILIIYLFVIGKIFYCDLPRGNKYSDKRIALSAITGFILFSYATQMLYMLLAMFRVVPLTGQSIPFLSLSRVENFFILFFIALTYIVIFSLVFEKDDNAGNQKDKDFGYTQLKNEFLDSFNGWKFLLWISIIVILCAGGWICNTLPEYDSTDSYNYRNHQKEAIFNKVLAKLMPTIIDDPEENDSDAPESDMTQTSNPEYNPPQNGTEQTVDIYNIVAQTDAKKLVEYYDKAIDEVTERYWFTKIYNFWKGRSAKNADILQVELSKLFYGRESKLKIKDGEIIYEDSKPTIKVNKFIARLSFEQKENFEKKINERKLKVVKNGADFYINFNSNIDGPKTLANIKINEIFDGGKILLDENAEIYTKRIDGEDRLQFCHGDIYGTLPISITDSERLKNGGLTIDERLQSLSIAAIESYCRNNNIMGGGIVVMDTRGNIIALASYPSLSPNALPNDKYNFVEENLHKTKSLYLFDGAPSVPLTSYPPASTWKMILGGVSVLVENSKCDNNLMNNIVPSNNKYFVDLMTEMTSDQHAREFVSRLENDFDIFPRGKVKYSNMFDASIIAGIEDLKNNTKKTGEKKGAREKVAIGHGDCRISLIALVQSLARIVTGERVKPKIFAESEAERKSFEKIQESGIFSCYKDILNKTSLKAGDDPSLRKDGTAIPLREAEYNMSKIFPKEKRLYAKTGTYGNKNKGLQTNYVIFGTENYFFGVILNEKPTTGTHAKELAKALLPYIKAFCPEYLD